METPHYIVEVDEDTVVYIIFKELEFKLENLSVYVQFRDRQFDVGISLQVWIPTGESLYINGEFPTLLMGVPEEGQLFITNQPTIDNLYNIAKQYGAWEEIEPNIWEIMLYERGKGQNLKDSNAWEVYVESLFPSIEDTIARQVDAVLRGDKR